LKGTISISLISNWQQLHLKLFPVLLAFRLQFGIKLKELMTAYRQKLQGHWNYYGVCGNSSSMNTFLWEANKIVFKWLNRRSQRKSYNWEGFRNMLEHFRIPKPKIIAQ
jgi:hypothetical protein